MCGLHAGTLQEALLCVLPHTFGNFQRPASQAHGAGKVGVGEDVHGAHEQKQLLHAKPPGLRGWEEAHEREAVFEAVQIHVALVAWQKDFHSLLLLSWPNCLAFLPEMLRTRKLTKQQKRERVLPRRICPKLMKQHRHEEGEPNPVRRHGIGAAIHAGPRGAGGAPEILVQGDNPTAATFVLSWRKCLADCCSITQHPLSRPGAVDCDEEGHRAHQKKSVRAPQGREAGAHLQGPKLAPTLFD